MANSERAIQGYTCEFVEAISGDIQIECSICLQVLRNPQMVDCCSNCIRRVSKCPLCNSYFSSTTLDKQLERFLQHKHVYCPSKDKGCSWMGQLSLLDRHLDVEERLEACMFLELRCKYCHCSFKKNQIEEHQTNQCPLSPQTCQYCDDFSGPRYTLDNHLKICGQYPLECPEKCGKRVVRAQVEKHVNNDCPLAIESCVFAFCGCQFKRERRDMRKHYEREVHRHLDMLLDTYVAKEQECSTLQQEKHTLEQEITDLKSKLSQFELEKQQSDKEIQLLKEFCSIQKSENGDADNSSSFEPEENGNRVLVGNFPYSANEHMARSQLGQYGRHSSVTFYPENKMAVVKYLCSLSVERLFEKYKSEGIKIHGCYLVCVHLQHKDCTESDH